MLQRPRQPALSVVFLVLGCSMNCQAMQKGLHSVSIPPTIDSNLRLRSRRAYYDASAGSSARRGLQ
jgi:hypothetical protein